MKKNLNIFKSLILISAISFYSCEKPPGPGGQASVRGKVYAYDYDNTQNYLLAKGYSAGEKVYIIYGDHETVDNNMVTSMGGVFEFKYLNKGHYRVFVNSLDTAYKVKGNDTENPVIKEFDIKGNKEVVDLGDIIINK